MSAANARAAAAAAAAAALVACGGGGSNTAQTTAAPPVDSPAPAAMLTFTVKTTSVVSGNVRLSVGADEAVTGPGAEQVSMVVAPGALATVTALPSSGRLFVYWTGGDCEDVSRSVCELEVRRDNVLLTAHFAALQRLSVGARALGGSGGEVSVSLRLLDSESRSTVVAGERAQLSVPAGARVALEPRPLADSMFVGWSGESCELSAGECEFTFTRDDTVTATFGELSRLRLNLAADAEAAGTLNVASAQLGTVPARFEVPAGFSDSAMLAAPRGAEVVLHALSAAGSALSPWDACRPGAGEAPPNPCTLRLNAADVAVDVRFVAAAALRVGVDGSGTVTVAGDFANAPRRFGAGVGSLNAPRATALSLAAAPDDGAGAIFSGWTQSAHGCEGFRRECAFALDADAALWARFAARRELLLVVTARESGAGAVIVSGRFDGSPVRVTGSMSIAFAAGTALRLTPEADAASVFFQWDRGPDNTSPCYAGPEADFRPAPDCALASDGNVAVGAVFSGADRVELAFDPIGSGVGAVAVSGTFAGSPLRLDAAADAATIDAPANTDLVIELRALSEPGSAFVGWGSQGVCAQAIEPVCSLAVTGDADWTARPRFQLWRLLSLRAAGYHGAGGTIAVDGVGYPPAVETLRVEPAAADAGAPSLALAQWRVADGATVMLSAVLDNGLVQWNAGAGAVLASTLDVVMDANREVTAEFLAQREVSVSLVVAPDVVGLLSLPGAIPLVAGVRLEECLAQCLSEDAVWRTLGTLSGEGTVSAQSLGVPLRAVASATLTIGDSVESVPLGWQGGACDGSTDSICAIPPSGGALVLIVTVSFAFAPPGEVGLTVRAEGPALAGGSVYYRYALVPAGASVLSESRNRLQIAVGLPATEILQEPNLSELDRGSLDLRVVPRKDFEFVRWRIDEAADLSPCADLTAESCELSGSLTVDSTITAVFRAQGTTGGRRSAAASARAPERPTLSGATAKAPAGWTLDVFGPGQVRIGERVYRGGRRHALGAPSAAAIGLRAERDPGLAAAARRSGVDSASLWEGWGAACAFAGSQELCVVDAEALSANAGVSARFAPFLVAPGRVAFGLGYDAPEGSLASLFAGPGFASALALAPLGSAEPLSLPLAAHLDDWPLMYWLESCSPAGDCAVLLGAQRELAVADVRASILRLAPAGAPGERWGRLTALSADGETAALASTSGVRVYRRLKGRWVAAQLSPPPPPPAALALNADGSTLALGAPSSSAGAVRLYRRAALNFLQAAELRSDAADDFGAAVSISADGATLAVGAPAAGPGSAQVFRRVRDGERWSALARLAPASGSAAAAPGARFGGALALSADGERLVVGAPGAGEAQLWRLAGSPALERRFAADGPAGRFGGALAIARARDGSPVVAVGAPTAAQAQVYWQGDAGAWRSWRPATDAGVRFGGALALSADAAWLALSDAGARCAAGAPAVRVFAAPAPGERPGAWRAHRCLASPSARAATGFGAALSLSASGQRLLVGAPDELAGAGYLH